MILGYECVYLLQGLLRDIHGCGAIPLPPLAAVRPRLSRPVSSATRNSACLLLIVFLDFLFSFLRGYGLDFCSPNFRKERLGCGRNCDLAQQQSPSGDLVSINRPPGVIVLTDRCSFQREASERALCTGVGQDLCIHLPIRAGLSMPSNGARRCGSVPSNLEVALEQLLHSLFILDDQYDVYSFYTDLQTPASARNRDERWCTPAIRGAASGYAFASFTSKDKTTFDHVWYDGHAFCMLQHFFGNSLVRHPHNFV